MIIQGTNVPIIFIFPASVADILAVEVSLYQEKRQLKHWNYCDVTIDDNKIIAPLKQSETILFPSGKCNIEVKWVDADGQVNFARNLVNTIVERFDKTVMKNEAVPYLGEELPDGTHGCGCCCANGMNSQQMYYIHCLSQTLVKKGYSPYVDEDTGTWWEYDAKTGKFVDTQIVAGTQPISFMDILNYWHASILEQEG